MPSDPVAEAIAAYRGSAPDDEAAKIDAIDDLEDRVDPRILPFFLEVLADPRGLDLARIEICEILQAREGSDSAERQKIAAVLAHVLLDDEDDDVRNYAANALARYVGEKGAREALESVLLDAEESRNVRQNAVFAIERAGPTSDNKKILQQLEFDPQLSRTARRILSEWEPDRDSDDDPDDEG